MPFQRRGARMSKDSGFGLRSWAWCFVVCQWISTFVQPERSEGAVFWIVEGAFRSGGRHHALDQHHRVCGCATLDQHSSLAFWPWGLMAGPPFSNFWGFSGWPTCTLRLMKKKKKTNPTFII